MVLINSIHGNLGQRKLVAVKIIVDVNSKLKVGLLAPCSTHLQWLRDHIGMQRNVRQHASVRCFEIIQVLKVHCKFATSRTINENQKR